MSGPWSKWTAEDWSNAEFCDTCGLPLLRIEPEEGEVVGKMMCVYCTWHDDELMILMDRLYKVSALVKELQDPLRDVLRASVAGPFEIHFSPELPLPNSEVLVNFGYPGSGLSAWEVWRYRWEAGKPVEEWRTNWNMEVVEARFQIQVHAWIYKDELDRVLKAAKAVK